MYMCVCIYYLLFIILLYYIILYIYIYIFNSIRLFGQTYTYNGLIQQKCIYRVEVTNAYNVL